MNTIALTRVITEGCILQALSFCLFSGSREGRSWHMTTNFPLKRWKFHARVMRNGVGNTWTEQNFTTFNQPRTSEVWPVHYMKSTWPGKSLRLEHYCSNHETSLIVFQQGILDYLVGMWTCCGFIKGEQSCGVHRFSHCYCRVYWARNKGAYCPLKVNRIKVMRRLM